MEAIPDIKHQPAGSSRGDPGYRQTNMESRPNEGTD